LKFNVVKSSGEIEPLDINKIRRSCFRSGASKELVKKIIKEISKDLFNGITTKEIYKRVHELLIKYSEPSAFRFRLKEAILNMGPSGFFFEAYISRILQSYGYKTRVGVTLKGACVDHEIDIIINKNSKNYFVECKYHNYSGIFTGLKETLYTYARFLDLKEGYDKGICDQIHGAWLVTNTKLSKEAKLYGRCKKMNIIGWNYPIKCGLQKLIEKGGLYPVTILKEFDKKELDNFLRSEIILAQDFQKLSDKKFIQR
jgi:hypothetical protein